MPSRRALCSRSTHNTFARPDKLVHIHRQTGGDDEAAARPQAGLYPATWDDTATRVKGVNRLIRIWLSWSRDPLR